MLFEYIRTGMVLNEDIIDERGNLLLESGAVLTESYLARLKQLGFHQFKVFDPYAASLRPQPAIPDTLRQDLTTCFSALTGMRWDQTQSVKLRYLFFKKIDTTVKQTIAHLETQIPDIVNLLVRQPSEDETSHSVNVCLLSIITGLHLRFPSAVLSDLAIGALLHDIGKTALPDEITSDNAYTHTLYGHSLLLANKFTSTIARIAAEHHERPDGAGYPMGLLGKDTHPLSRIVAITNYYDRAISLEKNSQLSRQEIVESMMVKGNATFDLNMLRAFFQTIAVYPIGSLVRLNSGKLAYVLKNKTRMPLRPCVELADASHLEIDLSLQPNMMIDQLIAE